MNRYIVGTIPLLAGTGWSAASLAQDVADLVQADAEVALPLGQPAPLVLWSIAIQSVVYFCYTLR